MGKKLDLTNQKFNRLVGVKEIGKDRFGRYIWLFKCTCGNYLEVQGSYVKNGYTKSCGCYRKDNLDRIRNDSKKENNSNWKGGISSDRNLDTHTPEYKSFRQQVFERDNYACQRCGKPSTGDIEAHHLLSYTYFPQYRLSVWNGITLCKTCHNWTHSNKNANKVYVMGAK